MFRRHCSLRVIEQHDECLLRLAAHEAGALDGSLHSTLTADVQTWCGHCASSPGKGAHPLQALLMLFSPGTVSLRCITNDMASPWPLNSLQSN